ncbi:uncharacterized protein LOC114268348 [Camellia sinensis]|uniref:uncharacterized protein LOC114268348 n=1 Tax=Camellia sinensis TaxID=4442 RepID=UPI001035AE3D|nr:uncharacterized protein LOC114268348 [Camellia sinensis]
MSDEKYATHTLCTYPSVECPIFTYCKTSIVDFHRSCPNCSFRLCLTCSREIRDGHFLGGGKEVIFQYIDNGRSCLHGGNAYPVFSGKGVVQHGEENNQQQERRRNSGGEVAERAEIWIYLLAQGPKIMRSQLLSGKRIKMVSFVVLRGKWVAVVITN